MKIFTNGDHVLGPYESIVQNGQTYLCDNEIVPAHIVAGWHMQDVADDYVHPNVVARLIAEQNQRNKLLREQAYKTEADALFFKAQRDEIEMQVWLDKVADIKARYPYE